MSVRLGIGLALVYIAACGEFTGASGAETTFQIDPLQSALTFSGTAFTNIGDPVDPLPFTAQAPGTLTAALTGQIVADTTGGTIALTGGTWSLVTQPGDWEPYAAAANFAFEGDGLIPSIGTMTGAMRDAVFIPTASATSTTPTADGFTFAVSGLVLTGTAGAVDFDGEPDGSLLGALAGVSIPLNGKSSTGTLVPLPDGSYTDILGIETLVIPVHVEFADFLDTSDIEWQLEGTIVARFVPEPATLVLLATTGFTVFARRRGVC